MEWGACKALWVIRESETSSQNAGSAVCSLYLDTAGSHGCRGAKGREGGKCDTKITTYRVVNMSLLCTYLSKVRGFNSNKTALLMSVQSKQLSHFKLSQGAALHLVVH